MEHGSVHLGVVVGAVQVDDMVREPAEGKEAHKHQHCLGKALPGFDLRRELHTERIEGPRGSVGGLQTKIQTEKDRGEEFGKETSSLKPWKRVSRRKGTRENQINERKASEADRKRRKSQKHRNGEARKQKSMRQNKIRPRH